MNIQEGMKAPDFELYDTTGKKVSLKDLQTEAKGGDILLIFFPLAFSSVCTHELCTIRDNMKLYNSLNTIVAGISNDSFFALREFKKANNLNYTLLSDYNKDVSTAFGAIYDDYFGMKGVSKRAAFIIDQGGIVKYAEVLDDSDKQPDFKSIRKSLMR